LDRAAQAEAHAWDVARRNLTRDVIAFAHEPRFAQSFADGLKLFWNGHYTIETADGMSEDESLRFFDWFAFDYTPADRPRLLEIYAAEKGAALAEVQRKQLDYWLAARAISAYRVESVEGDNIALRDVRRFDGRDDGWRERRQATILLARYPGAQQAAFFRLDGALVRVMPGRTRGDDAASV
jgi:hypothetical protein